MTWFEKQGREGLVPKKISETVRPKQGQTYERLTTVYVKPEVPEFVNDWLKNFDAQIPIYLVGGSVRDSILGKAPKDIDVITFNSKQDVENNLKSSSTKFYQGGKNLPNLLTANLGKNQLIDIISMDGDIETELVRRDFTINAMAQRPDGEIVDPFGGRQDLKNGVLKSPKGDSDKVFSEDPIRMLRAARFIGDLNLKADRSLTDSLKKQKDLLADMPKERIGMEFGRIMYSKDPVSALKFLKDNDLLKHIDPALQRMVGFVQNLEGHDFDTWNHTLKALDHHITKDKDKPDLATRLGILYHNVGKPPAANENNSDFKNYETIGAQIVEESLNSLRLPSDMVDLVRKLVQHHTSPRTVKTEGDHRRVQLKLRENLNKLNYVATAHEVGKEGNINANTDHIVSFQDTIDKLDPIDLENDKVTLSPLTGKEIMDELDIVPNRKGGGERIGKIKDFLNELVIEGELKQSDKKGAINRARQYHSTFTQKSNNLLKSWLNILKAEKDDGLKFDTDSNISWEVDKVAHAKTIENKKSDLFDAQRSKQGLVPVKITGADGIRRTYWCRPGFEDKMIGNNPNSELREQEKKTPYVGMFNLNNTHGHDSLDPKFKDKGVRLAHPEDSHDTHKHFTGEGKKGGILPAGIHELHISHDPYAEFGHKGKNKTIGRLSRSQGPGYTHPEIKELKDSQKEYRMKALIKQSSILDTELNTQYNSDKPDVRALITGIMMETGLRIGNPKDTFDSIKKGKESYATATFKKKHISVTGDTIKYNFPGKQETIQSGTIKNAGLAKGLETILKNKDEDAYVFEQDGKFYDEGDVQKYHNAVMKVKDGYVIKNHTFRHSKATNMTIKNITDFIGKAKNLSFIKTEGDFQDFQKRMATDAAKQLNHPDTKGEFWKTDMTLNSYILPNAFSYIDGDKQIMIKDQVDKENTKLSSEYQDKMQEITGSKKYNKVPIKTVQLDKAYDGKEFDPTRKKEKDIDTYFDNRKEKEEDRDLGLDKIPPHMRPRPKYYEAKFAKTWVEDLADKGYQSPVIKSSNDEGTKLWFIDGGIDYVANVGATGVGYIEKATFQPLPSNATNKISYDPTGNNMRKPNDNEEDLYEEE
jgi:tRNA nucleotidyltransferase (CCA-adding enzyme)